MRIPIYSVHRLEFSKFHTSVALMPGTTKASFFKGSAELSKQILSWMPPSSWKRQFIVFIGY
jgi:hypothetical protein